MLVCGFCRSAIDIGSRSMAAGKERDVDSGNDSFVARYYSSRVGRFMSPDPSGLSYADPANPQSFNLYAYAPSKPSVLDCASGFAQRTSIAGGLNRLGIGNNGGFGGFLTGALGGNAASGIVDLLRNGGSLADIAFSGTRLGVPGASTRLGNGISGVVQDTAAGGLHAAISTGGELTTLTGTFSTVGLTGAEYATGFGQIKFGYDVASYALGLAGCQAGVIH